MKYMARRQLFKTYTLVGFFATLISTVVLTGFACTKKPNVPTPLPDSHVPKEKPREGVVEPTQSPKQSKESIDISSDVKSIEGITWQGDYLWVLDDERKIIDRFDTTLEKLSPDPKYSIDLARQADLVSKKFKGLAYDKEAEALWVAAEEIAVNTKKMVPMLIKINLANRQTELIKMDIPVKKGFDSIEGIAWNEKEKCLLVAIYAGFSSSFNWIDPKTGEIKRSIFADCNPRGIATDGEYLWSICYNRGKLPSKIDKRKIEDTEHKMLRSRALIKDIEKDAAPVGLVYDGKDLWYADKIAKTVTRFTAPDTKQTPVQSQ